ncbi:MAG TPA: hypothetical protein VG676_11000 [Chitinophagaceae bacterium]|jgi:hypothetical protein|nr:hypothetical protein [Chitinophagaceae bacterium]
MQNVMDKIATADKSEQLMQPSLLNELALFINDLIVNDFTKLVQLLYRIDISEKKLKQLLSDNADKDAGKIIAELIIERQLQKIKSRQQFKSPGGIIDDSEKW